MPDTPASKMVRVRTALIPQVQRLSELCRQGHTESVVRGLNELINAIEAGTASTLPSADSAWIADVVARLERLESDARVPTVGGEDESLTQLTQRVANLENAMDELSSVVVEALRNKPQPQDGRRDSENAIEAIAAETLESEGDAESDSEPTPTLPPDLKPPLTQKDLAERLGLRYPYYLQKHRERGKAHFEAWSQSVDPDGLTWTFDAPKRRERLRGKALKFYPKV